MNIITLPHDKQMLVLIYIYYACLEKDMMEQIALVAQLIASIAMPHNAWNANLLLFYL